jgi:uncharacterized protein (TIGR02678 family)
VERDQEGIRQAAQALLENRWIMRSQMPEEYFLVRHYERQLRDYFQEKCGWPLLVNAQFYKLEKIPARPRAFMGIAAMQSVGDYTLLCCVLAFLEDQEVDGQFLLGDLCEALLGYYPQENAVERLNWESYTWRKALIRVLNYLLEEQVLRLVEDDSEAFLSHGYAASGGLAGEALYEVTLLARYFLRSYPKDLKSYHSVGDLCQTDFASVSDESAERLRQKRTRLYRQLLLQPAYYRQEDSEEDFVYLRTMYKRMGAELQEWFELNLELYQDCALVVSYDRSPWFKDVFPVRMRGIHDVLLLFSQAYREEPGWEKRLLLSFQELRDFLEQMAATQSSGWTKEFREMGSKQLTQTVLDEMVAWNMAQVDEAGLVHLQPALFRLMGRYPKDYVAGGAKKHDGE